MVVETPERLSIELTNRCAKQCPFCYNASHADGGTDWTAAELTALIADCARAGSKAVSFGGGEPLEYDELIAVLEATRGVVFRSMTTNGLLLDDAWIARLAASGLEKAHLSIHFPQSAREVARAIRLVAALEAAGVASGVNLLVAPDRIDASRRAADAVIRAGVGRERIVFLPLRGAVETPADAVADAARRRPFQSMSCLTGCAKSPRFAAISWDKRAAWCSYTVARRRLPALTAAGLAAALDGLALTYCGAARRAEQESQP